MRVPRRVAVSFSPKRYEGSLDAEGLRFGVVCARWNPTVTDAMLAAALDTLRRRGARAADILVARVPGAFEVPAAVRALFDSARPQAVIALAAIVRGETSHHEVLGHAVASAWPRFPPRRPSRSGSGSDLRNDGAGTERNDKGIEAAEAAIEMANLRRHLRKR